MLTQKECPPEATNQPDGHPQPDLSQDPQLPIYGRSGRIRTPDYRFWRPVLYQAELRSWMVPLEGLEPPTRDLGRRRSIQAELQGHFGGDRGARTPNLGIANAALSRLSYIPSPPL